MLTIISALRMISVYKQKHSFKQKLTGFHAAGQLNLAHLCMVYVPLPLSFDLFNSMHRVKAISTHQPF